MYRSAELIQKVGTEVSCVPGSSEQEASHHPSPRGGERCTHTTEMNVHVHNQKVGT